ncbi:MAG: energy transducer TonB [Bacteroidota bacterium]
MSKLTLILLCWGLCFSVYAQNLGPDCERIVALPTSTAYLTDFDGLSSGERSEQTQNQLSELIRSKLNDFQAESLAEYLYVEFTIDRKGQVANFFCDDESIAAHLAAQLPDFPGFIPATYRDEAVCSRLGFEVSTLAPAPELAIDPADIHRVVEQMPLFYSEGCSEDAPYRDRKTCAEGEMLMAIYGNVKYPAAARAARIEGMAVVSFLVSTDGSAYNHVVVRDPGGGCGEEALRVVQTYLTHWIPGTEDGVPVNVQFNLPVKFKLE